MRSALIAHALLSSAGDERPTGDPSKLWSYALITNVLLMILKQRT